MSNAVSGHGALLAMELDPSGAQGTFTNIAEIISDINPGYNRVETEVTPHNDTIDSYVTGVIRRESWSFQVNFLHDDATSTHIATAASGGIQDQLISQQTFGMRFRGNGGATGVDEIIVSGEIISFMQSNPVREGQRTADVVFRPSGPMILDGITVGTTA